jgi:hypothetical protein
MLSTFLSQLQSYFSKYFVVGSFCPMLVFAFVNGLTAYFLFGAWRRWVDVNFFKSDIGRGAFVTTSLVVAIVLAGYVLSSLSTFLRRLMEGEWWDPLAKLFIPAQNRRRQRLIDNLTKAAMDIVDLRDAPRWEQSIRDSRDIGRLQRRGTEFQPPTPDPLKNRLNTLEKRRGKNEIVAAEQLHTCADQIGDRFRNNDVDFSPYLERQHQRLGALIDYAKQRAQARHSRLLNALNSNFGTQEVAPTKMGNVANTIQSYALRRYHCNLEIIWSNLQRIVQKDEKALAALQEAKTQLDFLVACCWLTLLWAAAWTLVLGLIEPSRKGFLAAALGGPIIAYVWYRAAAEQYRSFADIAMTTLDAFRFDLLREMRLGAPSDIEGERYLWESIDRLTTYGEVRNFRYELPKQTLVQ